MKYWLYAVKKIYTHSFDSFILQWLGSRPRGSFTVQYDDDADDEIAVSLLRLSEQ